jgi:hypothetical protein
VFSQLGPLFKSQLRQAEKSDARLEIRRDEKQEHGKKQEQEEEAVDTSALWEDSTAVSVEALKAFLVEFLKSRGDEVPEAPETSAVETDIALTPEYRPPVNTRTAQAVKAYGAMAAQTAAPAPPPEPLENKASEEPIDLVSLLKADEVRTMHVLITELDMLSRKGVQTLIIEKADTFLEALVLAVRLEKTKA